MHLENASRKMELIPKNWKGKKLHKNGNEATKKKSKFVFYKLRQPLDEEQSNILTTMLEEFQGAGLGWDHLFVQCRLQGALFSLRNKVPMPRNLCSNLAPDPEEIDPQSPLAFIRFRPPDNSYADEVYYPPPKKGFDDRFVLLVSLSLANS